MGKTKDKLSDPFTDAHLFITCMYAHTHTHMHAYIQVHTTHTFTHIHSHTYMQN